MGPTHAVLAAASIREGFVPGTRGCIGGEAMDRRVLIESCDLESDLVACDFEYFAFAVGATPT